MKNPFWKSVFLLLALLASFPAWATVAITPTAIIIEGRQRYADVTLINTSDTVDTYEMGWRYTRMQEGSGEYQATDTPPTAFDLGKHLVFTPRRVTMAPHASQKIRMALRLNGAPPAPGDYRAHFLVHQIGSVPRTGSEPKSGTDVGATIRIGFTIPVIYRVGESDATAKIGDVRPQVNKESKRLELVVPVTKNQSPFSIMGELGVVYETPDGSKRRIGGISNAHIFPEIAQRNFVVPLNVPSLQGGTLRVTYRGFDGKTVIDEKRVPVGK